MQLCRVKAGPYQLPVSSHGRYPRNLTCQVERTHQLSVVTVPICFMLPRLPSLVSLPLPLRLLGSMFCISCDAGLSPPHVGGSPDTQVIVLGLITGSLFYNQVRMAPCR